MKLKSIRRIESATPRVFEDFFELANEAADGDMCICCLAKRLNDLTERAFEAAEAAGTATKVVSS